MKNWRTRKPSLVDAADADQESTGAGAAGESGGLGVEKSPGGGMGARDGAAGERIEQIVREFDQIGDFVTAVALVAG